jgi:hypothetical protein
MSEIDTANRYMVGVKGDAVVVLLPPTTVLSKEGAYVLAALLVDKADQLPGPVGFGEVYEAVTRDPA